MRTKLSCTVQSELQGKAGLGVVTNISNGGDMLYTTRNLISMITLPVWSFAFDYHGTLAKDEKPDNAAKGFNDIKISDYESAKQMQHIFSTSAPSNSRYNQTAVAVYRVVTRDGVKKALFTTAGYIKEYNCTAFREVNHFGRETIMGSGELIVVDLRLKNEFLDAIDTKLMEPIIDLTQYDNISKHFIATKKKGQGSTQGTSQGYQIPNK